jgi:MoxR-like ATPase
MPQKKYTLTVPRSRVEEPVEDEEYYDDEDLEEIEELEVDDEEKASHAYIPDPEYGLKYVNRTIDGILDFDLLTYCLKKGINLLLEGDTGAGKTMFPMAYASMNCIPYYSIPCDVSIDPRALFGKMMPTDRVGEFQWVDGPVTELVRYGGILNISEVNFMPAKIAASLYQLLDHRRSLTLLEHEGETIKAHPDLLIVADYNPKYRGTMDLNIAFANRFAIKRPWGYHDDVETSIVKSPELLDLVRKIRKEPSIRTPIGTNMMLEFVTLASDLGVEFAMNNFVGKFGDVERDPVKKLMDVHSVNIKRDIEAYQSGKKSDDLLDEIEEDPSWYNPESEDDEYELEPE